MFVKQTDETVSSEDDTTIFVKNLNFETTEEAVRAHFSGAGTVHAATVARKRRESDGQMLSMGSVHFYLRRRSMGHVCHDAIKSFFD